MGSIFFFLFLRFLQIPGLFHEALQLLDGLLIVAPCFLQDPRDDLVPIFYGKVDVVSLEKIQEIPSRQSLHFVQKAKNDALHVHFSLSILHGR